MFPLIRIFDRYISSYGVMIVIGCALCAVLSIRRSKHFGCSGDNTAIILACVGGVGIAFAKLLYLFVSVPFDTLLQMIREGRIQSLIEGGQVFYGGVIGGVVGFVRGLRIIKEKAGAYMLTIVPTIPLAHALGRVGCFMAGCCYGIPYNGFGSFAFTNPIGGAPISVPLFPVQLLEALLNMALFVLLTIVSYRKISGMRITLLYIGLYSINRLFLEYLRYDAVRGGAWIFSTSQWISIALIIGSFLMDMFLRKRENASMKSPANDAG